MSLAIPENIDEWDKGESMQASSAVTDSLVGLRNHFVCKKAGDLTESSNALKAVDTKVLSIVEETYSQVSEEDGNELRIVQPLVRKVIGAAVEQVGKTGYSYSLMGGSFQSTRQRVKDPGFNATRVYFPLSGKCDIEIVAGEATEENTLEVKTDPTPPSFFGPCAEG